jgi:hypothetical protein
MHVSQATLKAVVVKGQAIVFESQQMQDGRVEFID